MRIPYNFIMLTLAILCGGKSSRIGQEKGLLPFLGRPLIQRILNRLSLLAREVIISANDPTKYSFLGLPIHADIYPDCGSLGGLYTCMVHAKNPLVAAVACDLPFASQALLAYEISLLVKEKADAVVPRSPDGLEPLHAVYRRETCLPIIEKALDDGRYKMIGWFPEAKVIEIPHLKILEFDPDGLAFLNINTPEEFIRAEQIARRQE
jgi:molybdopterin-guanine dinucleotide biosynthesis protein A